MQQPQQLPYTSQKNTKVASFLFYGMIDTELQKEKKKFKDMINIGTASPRKKLVNVNITRAYPIIHPEKRET